MTMETVAWSMCVSPAGVRDRLSVSLPDLVAEPIAFGPSGFGLALYTQTGRRKDRRLSGSVLVTQAPLGGEPWLPQPTEWLHASIDRLHRMPSYDDLKALHMAVFGSRYAYQVFAPPDAHVNISKYVLHLWGRVDDVDGRVLPDFGKHGTI